MDITQTSSLITGLVTTFGGAVLVIITATVGLGVAYLVFRFGWSSVQRSLNTAPRGVNAFMTTKRYGIRSNGERYDTWSS